MRFELGGAFWYIGSLAVVTKSDFALASKCFYGFASSRPSNAESYDETILSLHITASMYVMSYVGAFMSIWLQALEALEIIIVNSIIVYNLSLDLCQEKGMCIIFSLHQDF